MVCFNLLMPNALTVPETVGVNISSRHSYDHSIWCTIATIHCDRAGRNDECDAQRLDRQKM